MITDKEAYGLAFTDRLGRRIYKISSLLHEKKTRVLGPFKAADRFGSGLRELERARAAAAPPYMWTYVHLQRPWGHTKPGRGSQPAIRFPLFLKAGPPKNTVFWRNRALFPVASRSNPRCSKAQIASYLAQIRRFLALTAWASSTSTTGSRRFWACFFGQWLEKGRGCPWHACGTIGWNNTMTYPSEESNLYISPYPWIWRAIPTRAGIAVAHWQGKGMPGRSCHLPQIPLFLKETRQKTAYFGKIGRFSPSPLEAIHAAAKLKLRAIWPK